jgi:hypothetical protein
MLHPCRSRRPFRSAAPRCCGATESFILGNAVASLWNSRFLEPETAARYPDPALQTALDLSHVTHVATANFAENLPGPSWTGFDRSISRNPSRTTCRPCFPPLANLARERGLDPRFVPLLSGAKLSAIAKHWRGGSLRLLRRIVEVVLRERNARGPQLTATGLGRGALPDRDRLPVAAFDEQKSGSLNLRRGLKFFCSLWMLGTGCLTSFPGRIDCQRSNEYSRRQISTGDPPQDSLQARAAGACTNPRTIECSFQFASLSTGTSSRCQRAHHCCAWPAPPPRAERNRVA